MESSIIKGLVYKQDFITIEDELKYMEFINNVKVNTSIKRRTIHYGYNYDYTKKGKLTKADEIPKLFDDLKSKFKTDVNQLIVNIYEPGQGISKHKDKGCFEDFIYIVSLGSDIDMVFENTKLVKKITKRLERRSLVILSLDARWKWTHCIPARKSDIVDGKRVSRNKRISLTFRKVKL